MPRNRPELDRHEKEQALLDVAERLFLAEGFDATTMAAIARGAGLTVNSVYWYFPSKDHLLAAISERRLARAVQRVLAEPSASLARRAELVMEELDAAATLTTSIHERAKHAPVVAEAHQAFHTMIEGHVLEALRQEGLAEADARLALAALAAMVEGFHLHDHHHDEPPRTEVLAWVLERLTT